MQLIGSGVTNEQIEVIAARRFDVMDVTDDITAAVRRSGLHDGLVLIFCRHTTCGVTINEFEDGLMEDFESSLAALVPDGYFAHDDMSRRTQNLQGPTEPENGAAHVRQMLFGATAQAIPLIRSELALGRWQRVLFVEYDRPKRRSILVTVLGS